MTEAERARRKARGRGAALNAFVTVLPEGPDEARHGSQDTALRGMPFAVKSNIAVRGHPTLAGFAASEADAPSPRDATVVTRLRAAGALPIGITTMDEGALGAAGLARGVGPIGNPVAPGFSPGGSSGGSAAAVAAGIVPLALGTDTMGSVRIPAAYCGVVGFKPSRGVLSRAGVAPLAPGFDHVGLIGASVGDIARTLPVLAGPDTRDTASRALGPADPDPALQAGDTLHGRVFGVPVFLRDATLEPPVRAAFEQVCVALGQAGARLVPLEWDARFSATLRRETFLLVEHEASEALAGLIDGASARVSPALRQMLAFGRSLSPTRTARACAALAEIASTVASDTAGIDAVITPTTPQRAFRHGAPPPPDQADFTVLANVTGLPALSVPLRCADRPVGLQVMGRDLKDIELLRIGAVIASLPATP